MIIIMFVEHMDIYQQSQKILLMLPVLEYKHITSTTTLIFQHGYETSKLPTQTRHFFLLFVSVPNM